MSSRAMVETVSKALGDLCDRFVFIGGTLLELLVTDPTVSDFRPTTDVDLIVEAVTYGAYAAVEQLLSDRGFPHVVDRDAPMFRWRIGEVIVDVMPTNEHILGFGSRWYSDIVHAPDTFLLSSGRKIHVATPAQFLATKLDAFHTRGNGDARVSYDMEDIIAILDGRPGIEEEVDAAPAPIRAFLAAEFSALDSDLDFQDAIQGYLSVSPDPVRRREALLGRVAAIIRSPS